MGWCGKGKVLRSLEEIWSGSVRICGIPSHPGVIKARLMFRRFERSLEKCCRCWCSGGSEGLSAFVEAIGLCQISRSWSIICLWYEFFDADTFYGCCPRVHDNLDNVPLVVTIQSKGQSLPVDWLFETHINASRAYSRIVQRQSPIFFCHWPCRCILKSFLGRILSTMVNARYQQGAPTIGNYVQNV